MEPPVASRRLEERRQQVAEPLVPSAPQAGEGVGMVPFHTRITSFETQQSSAASYRDVAGLTDLAYAMDGSSNCAHVCSVLLRSLGAVGVVYGDIGTSPLYTLSSCYAKGEQPQKDDLVCLASCLVWALSIVVVVKYIIFVMQADHEGEGGIFALLLNVPKPAGWFLQLLAVIGASMIIGDGMITPAMSVLSAFEGLKDGALKGQGLDDFVIPATIFALLCLFAVQPFGIGRIGRFFGPIMVVYFLAIAIIGVMNITRHGRWEVFQALNPIMIFRYFFTGRFRGWQAFWKLGSVVLAVTGAEALYADMGHFGRAPLVISWFALVYPSLILGYLGQAAFLVDYPAQYKTAFWDSVPPAIYAPMMVLVALATIIASQALIAGCYSLVDQAVVLGLFPRVKTEHTDSSNRGQIFIPEVCWALCVCTIAMVLVFRASSNMAGAYGIAVTSTFFMTSMLYFAVTRRVWGWSLLTALCVVVPMLCVDLLFLSANLPKVLEGGWVPLAVGLFLSMMMLTWQWGQQQVSILAARPPGVDSSSSSSTDVKNTMEVVGIFLLESPLPQREADTDLPAQPQCPSWGHLAESTGSLPRFCILLALDPQRDVPHVPDADKLRFASWPAAEVGEAIATKFYARVLIGFAESLAELNIERVLEPALEQVQAYARASGTHGSLRPEGLPVRYFLGNYQYRAASSSRLPRRLLIRIFRSMNACCRGTVSFLDLPLNKVFLVGGVLEL